MNIMILAAGEGTRFRPYTTVKPKPAIPFLNVPLAFYSLAFLENTALDNIIVNTFHLPEKIVKTFERAGLPKKSIRYSHEKGGIQGSGGALKFAEKMFDKSRDILMMNGDEVILPHEPGWINRAKASHKESGALATLFVTEHPEVGSKFGGVWVEGDRKVVGIGKESPSSSAKGFHFIGVFIISPRVFDYLPAGESHIFTDVLLPAMAAGEKVQIFPLNAHWFETGNLSDYLKATEECVRILNSNSFEASYLKRIVKRFSPMSVTGPNGVMHPSARVDANIEGFAILGEGASVRAPIKNCVLDNFATVSGSAENELFLKD